MQARPSLYTQGGRACFLKAGSDPGSHERIGARLATYGQIVNHGALDVVRTAVAPDQAKVQTKSLDSLVPIVRCKDRMHTDVRLGWSANVQLRLRVAKQGIAVVGSGGVAARVQD